MLLEYRLGNVLRNKYDFVVLSEEEGGCGSVRDVDCACVGYFLFDSLDN